MAKVKIYSTTTCPYCKMEKDYLSSKSVEFENVFVDQDENAVKEMLDLSGQLGVPFTVITKDDQSKITILGFDRPKIDEALGL